MKKITQLCRSLFMTLLMVSASLAAKEVVVRSPSGVDFILDVQPEDTFCNVIELLKGYFTGNEYLGMLEESSESNEFILDFTTLASSSKKTKKGRDYFAGFSKKDKEDISFIINTLGMSSLVTIAKNKSALKKAGDRIDHVHPLRFLECIFGDEKMKVSMYNMQDRMWVWKDFLGGLKGSMEQEIANNNVTPDLINLFCNHLAVDYKISSQLIQEHRWSDLTNYLINAIPRNGDPGRYDM